MQMFAIFDACVRLNTKQKLIKKISKQFTACIHLITRVGTLFDLRVS